MAKQRYVRFWSKRSIVSLIGIDYKILERSEHDNLPKFYFAGFLVLGILGISFCAVFYAFDLMFDMWHAEILLSSFFSLMSFTIYIFLIQTFSKEVFPTTFKLKFFNLSNLSRIGFVLMIGLLIAQPVKIFLYRDRLDIDISKYKLDLYQKFASSNANLYAPDLQKLFVDKARYELMPNSQTLADEIKKIKVEIQEINNQVNLANNKAQESISNANFFIKRIELASTYPGAFFLVMLIVALFFAPIALIYSISGKSKYYQLKKKEDKALVIKAYLNFKSHYSYLMEKKSGLKNIQFHEPFLDPPFNTIRKPLPVYLSQQDFFNNLME